mmetsp:Transcript_32566/g.73570  ORF Transcript_32566/g.73570 Transcript_32566/m.73570 type:complete len:521 (+) Transcript_32566:103-1665(+)
MEVVPTLDKTNPLRVRALFKDLVGSNQRERKYKFEVFRLAFRYCSLCTYGPDFRYCSPACQLYRQHSRAYFESEAAVESGKVASWKAFDAARKEALGTCFETWRECAERYQMAQAMYSLGFVHEHGRGVGAPDASEAIKWYEGAAARGHPEALCALATLHRDGRGLARPDDRRALKLFRGAGKSGNPDALYNVGKIYQLGRAGVPRDLKLGSKLIAAAHVAGPDLARPAACTALAHFKGHFGGHLRGVGAKEERERKARARSAFARDPAEAVRLWEAAAQRGYPRAQYNLGLVYAKGNPEAGVAKDVALAAMHWRGAADQGHAAAQHGLALLFMQGHRNGDPSRGSPSGSPSGEAPAVEAPTRTSVEAPELSSGPSGARSQGSVGARRAVVAGLPDDEESAVELWRRAAGQLHGVANACLGLCAERGVGGFKLGGDRRRALELYQRALDEGFEPARRRIERLRVPGGLRPVEGHAKGRNKNKANKKEPQKEVSVSHESEQYTEETATTGASTSPFWEGFW